MKSTANPGVMTKLHQPDPYIGAKLGRKPAPFLWLSSRLLKGVEEKKYQLTPTEIALLVALAYHNHGSSRDVVFPSQARLMELIGVSSRMTITKAVDSLEKKGLLHVISGKTHGWSNHYIIKC